MRRVARHFGVDFGRLDGMGWSIVPFSNVWVRYGHEKGRFKAHTRWTANEVEERGTRQAYMKGDFQKFHGKKCNVKQISIVENLGDFF